MDSRIVAVAMRKLHEEGFSRATLSGDAWNCCKRMIGTSDGKTHGSDNWKWDYYFPKLQLSLDKTLRLGYAGGLNISRHQGRNDAYVMKPDMAALDLFMDDVPETKISADLPIKHYDIHNSYGKTMHDDPLPFGIPTYTEDWPPCRTLFVAQIRLKMRLKEGLIPVWQFKNGVDNVIEGWEHGTQIVETYFWHDITITSYDLKTL